MRKGERWPAVRGPGGNGLWVAADLWEVAGLWEAADLWKMDETRES